MMFSNLKHVQEELRVPPQSRWSWSLSQILYLFRHRY